MEKKTFVLLLFLFSRVCYAQTGPSIQFTFVPDWGGNNLLTGKVHHTTLSDHAVAVYIFVEEAGGWWNKPYAASPLSLLQPDSGFSANIVTAGIDQYATKIIAFLLPFSFSPPVLSGGDLPGVLFSYPYVISCRPHGNRIISWSGFDWIVKKSVGTVLLPIGPGPGIFSDNDSMVWVDTQQKLHLRLAKHGNDWHCTEIIGTASQGYKRYGFDIAGRLDLLDRNIIAGIFTWDDCSQYANPPDNSFREIDLEFSRWGSSTNMNSQFVVQPYEVPGNMNRFNMNLAGLDHSVHSFEWRSNAIVFTSVWGDSSYSWKYSNPAYIPVPASENVRINLHLFNAIPPSDQRNAELVLNSFKTGINQTEHFSGNVLIFPNPFERICTVDIRADHFGEVEVGVIDLQGILLKKIFSGRRFPDSRKIEWDGNTDAGKPLRPGMYLIFVRDEMETRFFKIIKM